MTSKKYQTVAEAKKGDKKRTTVATNIQFDKVTENYIVELYMGTKDGKAIRKHETFKSLTDAKNRLATTFFKVIVPVSLSAIKSAQKTFVNFTLPVSVLTSMSFLAVTLPSVISPVVVVRSTCPKVSKYIISVLAFYRIQSTDTTKKRIFRFR